MGYENIFPPDVSNFFTSSFCASFLNDSRYQLIVVSGFNILLFIFLHFCTDATFICKLLLKRNQICAGPQFSEPLATLLRFSHSIILAFWSHRCTHNELLIITTEQSGITKGHYINFWNGSDSLGSLGAFFIHFWFN